MLNAVYILASRILLFRGFLPIRHRWCLLRFTRYLIVWFSRVSGHAYTHTAQLFATLEALPRAPIESARLPALGFGTPHA